MEYYKAQSILPEGEWERFIACLKTPLPASFRINDSGQFAAGVQSGFEKRFSGLMAAGAEHEYVDEATQTRVVVPPPKPLEWYPGRMAWQVNLSRHQLRRLPQFAELHEWIKRENETGTITRQEAVSMIPPLLLDVQPQHRVLDMCAAPGSKTFQLLERLHATEDGAEPTGIVVANDVNVQRCHLLIHQTKRVNSANLMVTQHEAQSFPMVGRKWKPEGGGPDDTKAVRFDRVLCDVPCSGDGTIRKAPDIWRKWNVASGNGLHRLQTRIAQRGARLLEVGGRLVYSTCSLNPIENEAVVAELLRTSKGALKLLDVTGELPALSRNAGLRSWKVKGRKQWYDTLQEVDNDVDRLVGASFFPPEVYYDPSIYAEALDQVKAKAEEAGAQAEGEQKSPETIAMETAMACAAKLHAEVPLPLERCMRLLPHHQDTGGFFVAVMEKVSEWPKDVRTSVAAKQAIAAVRGDADPAELARVAAEEAAKEAKARAEKDARIRAKKAADAAQAAEQAAAEGGADAGQGGAAGGAAGGAEGGAAEGATAGQSKGKGNFKEKQQGQHKGIDPIIMWNDPAVISSLHDFYGIAADKFPFETNLLVRSVDAKPKRVYYVSEPVRRIMEINASTHELKVVVVGIKLFERQEVKGATVPCSYRLAQEGLGMLDRLMTKQVVRLSLKEMHDILAARSLPRHHFEGHTGEQLDACYQGCCVIRLREGETLPPGTVEGAAPLAVTCWKGPASLNLLIPATEAFVILEQLGGEKPKKTGYNGEKGKQAQQGKPAAAAEGDASDATVKAEATADGAEPEATAPAAAPEAEVKPEVEEFVPMDA